MVKRAASGRAAPCQRREAAMSEAEEMDEEVAIATLPLDAWHRAKNARMVEFAGYYMPIQYEGIMAEHLWTRTSAGLFDVSHMGQIVLSGEGAAEAPDALVPGDIDRKSGGEGKRGSVR